jgi:hypothetical protein
MKKTLIASTLWILLASFPVSSPAADSFSMEGTGIVTAALDNCAGKYFCVLNLFRGSPAQYSGLRIGDRIMTVNGKKADSFRGTFELDSALNPPAGSTVRLEVERMGRIVEDPRKSLTFDLQSKVLDISARNVPDLGFPPVRVLEPAGGTACGTNLTQRDPVRQGDQFFVFSQGRSLGTATLWKRGQGFHVHFNNLPRSRDLSSMKGAQLVFYRPVRQSFHNRRSCERTWPEPPPQPKPNPLYVSYSKRRDLSSLLGEVLSLDTGKRVLTVKVVKDVTSVPLSGPPPPGGTGYNLVTTTYEHLPVHYPARVDAIPRDALRQIEKGDYVGVYFRKKGEEFHAEMIHLLSR